MLLGLMVDDSRRCPQVNSFIGEANPSLIASCGFLTFPTYLRLLVGLS